ncbi:Ku protein [Streptomyces sp. NPDC092369]|uniref:Ku protein n=1 Tax=Streptomyces sp. NPDC092369 TaxID=3366015 RepID=UPI00381285ED
MLLRQALERSSKVAVAKFAWRGRERPGLLRVRGEAIVLHSMFWPDEIRDPAAVAPAPVPLDDSEIDQAVTLIETMTRDDITGPEFTDGYTTALRAVIEAKQEGHRLPDAPEPAEQPGQLVDLMAALQESVTKARTARGEGTADVHDLPATRKKAAAGKTAKKTPSKKVPADAPQRVEPHRAARLRSWQ